MIHMFKAENGELYYVVKARNGEVLLTSETFKRKQGVMKSIAALIEVIKSDSPVIDNTTTRRTKANTTT